MGSVQRNWLDFQVSRWGLKKKKNSTSPHALPVFYNYGVDQVLGPWSFSLNLGF